MPKTRVLRHLLACAGLSILAPGALLSAFAQAQPALAAEPAPSATFALSSLTLRLDPESRTAAGLLPKGVDGFDYLPSDRADKRRSDGFHHLGDITFRARLLGATGAGADAAGRDEPGAWRDYSSAAKRAPVLGLPAGVPALAADDLSPTLPADCPLRVVRTWSRDPAGNLVLRFELENRAAAPVELGGLGFPMVFNNIITDRSLEQAHAACSFSDPYIGGDAGYLQVVRLTGLGPVLLVVPEAGTRTPFEAYRPLDEPMHRQQTWEGNLEWTVHSRAYAEREWSRAEPWNSPGSATLAPGARRVYGLTFLLAPEIRAVETTLAANDRPVAVGIPGYVLPTDLDARLFLKTDSPVASIEVEPAGAIDIAPLTGSAAAPASKAGWRAYALRGRTWGRARVLVTHADGTYQTIHYKVIKPAAEAVADLGNFLFTKQWFEEPADPFGRSPSVISYDRETDRQIVQESRAWIAGLGDEGGAGSWLAAAMKQFGQPDADELAKFERFIDGVLWGTLQFKDGPQRHGVRKSAFFYDPKALPDFPYREDLDWKTWTSWDKKHSEDIGRGYNYPHTVAAYWSMYRVARNHPGLIKNHDWSWYLTQAYETTRFAFSRDEQGRRRVGWVELGMMEGTIFLRLLEDLRHEGRTAQAADIETLMKERADRWKTEAYPFGSEMAWDSTGQEEVYAWCDYFGYDDKALVSLNSILAYMPAVPHWGYNGNARRYWDFLYGGKLSRIERQIHHYGSGLNAIPALGEYRKTPADLHLLRVGYGGTMGALTNIDQEGFASAAFHSFPSTLRWDAYSGDYGPSFLGHALNTATYLVDHPDFGWVAFGGNVERSGDWIKLAPRDSFRRRVYLAPRGLWLTLDAGAFEAVELHRKTGAVRIALAPKNGFTPAARLRVEQPARLDGVGPYRPARNLPTDAGAFTIPLGARPTWIELEN